MIKVRVFNAPQIETFHVEDIALKSGDVNKDRQFSGEPFIPLSRDTVSFSVNNKTTPLMPQNKKQKRIFDFDNLMKAGILLMIVFGLYAIGGVVLLLLSGIGISTLILLFILGVIPSNLFEKSKARVQRTMTKPLTVTGSLVI